MPTILLPRPDRTLERHALGPASPYPSRHAGGFCRTVYAAAHVVADPWALTDPQAAPAVDWETTLAFRHHLWGLGFKIAEAMDTAQRGMGLDWNGAKELIARSLAEARTVPGADLACGAGTDQLDPATVRSLDQVTATYEEQLGHIEAHGGRAILMASRALCAREGRPALAGGDVRCPARGLLGQHRGRRRHGDLPRADRGPCRQDRRH